MAQSVGAGIYRPPHPAGKKCVMSFLVIQYTLSPLACSYSKLIMKY